MITGIILVVVGIVLLILFLYNDLDKRVKNLYSEDWHNTNRPKVDILEDELDKDKENIWDKIRENKKAIEQNALGMINKVDKK